MSGERIGRRDFVERAAAGAALVGGTVSPLLARAMTPAQGVTSPIIVACAPLAASNRGDASLSQTVAEAKQAAIGALVVPALSTEHPADAMKALMRFRHAVTQRSAECRLVERADDLASFTARGQVALVAHAHGLQFIGRDLTLLAPYHAAGLRVAKLCAGWRNLAADGCYEASNLDLTAFGREAVRALNDARIVVDLAHTGRRSSLTAMQLTTQPVVFSHVNAAAVHAHPLNLTDEQITACARTGGVIGVSAFPSLVSSAPTLDGVLRHIEHIVRLVGVNHVALGLDFDDRRQKRYSTDPIPEPPFQYPEGVARLADVPGLSARLAAHGYSAPDRAKMLGGNLERVLRQVWGEG